MKGSALIISYFLLVPSLLVAQEDLSPDVAQESVSPHVGQEASSATECVRAIDGFNWETCFGGELSGGTVVPFESYGLRESIRVAYDAFFRPHVSEQTRLADFYPFENAQDLDEIVSTIQAVEGSEDLGIGYAIPGSGEFFVIYGEDWSQSSKLGLLHGAMQGYDFGGGTFGVVVPPQSARLSEEYLETLEAGGLDLTRADSQRIVGFATRF
jgi:hypothetical protein